MLPAQSRPLVACGCGGSAERVNPPRRAWPLVVSLLPMALWVLMPKCPLCVASYLALWTGLSLSFIEAALLRQSLLGFSGVLIVVLVLRQAYWFGKKRGRLMPASGAGSIPSHGRVGG